MTELSEFPTLADTSYPTFDFLDEVLYWNSRQESSVDRSTEPILVLPTSECAPPLAPPPATPLVLPLSKPVLLSQPPAVPPPSQISKRPTLPPSHPSTQPLQQVAVSLEPPRSQVTIRAPASNGKGKGHVVLHFPMAENDADEVVTLHDRVPRDTIEAATVARASQQSTADTFCRLLLRSLYYAAIEHSVLIDDMISLTRMERIFPGIRTAMLWPSTLGRIVSFDSFARVATGYPEDDEARLIPQAAYFLFLPSHSPDYVRWRSSITIVGKGSVPCQPLYRVTAEFERTVLRARRAIQRYHWKGPVFPVPRGYQLRTQNSTKPLSSDKK